MSKSFGTTISLFALLTLAVTAPVQAEVLTADTIWQGEVRLADDVLVPAGVTLTVMPGTVVTISPAESTKIDPEFISHQNEILVRGTLKVEGKAEKRVSFTGEKSDDDSRWAGILVDGGTVEMTQTTIARAETGLYLFKGKAAVQATTFEDNRYGVIADGSETQVTLSSSVLRQNDYGLFTFNGAKVTEEGGAVKENRKKDRFSGQAKTARIEPLSLTLPSPALTRAYTNETLVGNTTWRGRIRIEGQVRLPPEGRLLIMPGTVVEFTKKDTNNDGIGENGILIQGSFIAKGTKEQPILFRSAEKEARPGDWDSINILGSDQQQNLIEFCQVEHAYRGLHFHFSAVAVTNSILRHNYRGIQFQESVVELRDNQFSANKSGLQCRDSDVVLTRNQLFDNIIGANLYRLNLQATGNTFANNRWDGLRIREGAATVEQNMMVGNRFGLQVSDAVFGRFNRNLIAASIETGLALKNTDNIETSNNAIQGNGINGMIIREARGQVTGNFISDNGERGIGILSFIGKIAGNTIVDNGLYGIGLEGSDNIDAAGNWWGASNLDKEIYDKKDEPALGTVAYEPKAPQAMPFVWPVSQVPVDLSWSQQVTVASPLTVPQGAALSIKPGSTVRFGPEIGMEVYGRIEAGGLPDKRITFTAVDATSPVPWGEIKMERATGSFYVNCDFRKATWALHSHYVDLKVSRCLFEDNEGGLRMNSGPVEVRQSFFRHNRIGLRSYLGIGTVRDCDFRDNEIAVFVREKGSNVQVNHNNIVNSSRYAVRLGDFNDEDLDAKENWWGGKPVVDNIFDGRREAYIGKVLFEPELTAPVSLEWQAPERGKP